MGSNCCKCAEKKSKQVTSLSSASSEPWTRGGEPLLGDRFSSSSQRGAVTLTVRNASVEDSGNYSLSALNESGQSQSDLLLQVSARPGDVPVFLRRLNDLAVKVGTRTRFLVEIRSPTQVKVSWEQEGKSVFEGERYHLLHEGNFFCVDVAPVTLEDAGLWICRAHNANGTASCFCHLNVLVPKAYKSPYFIEELVAILTQQGTVSLECKVVGIPTPTLKWFKDNQEIKAGDVFALSANPEDASTLGTYTCEATNCMGKAYSTSRVHILTKEGNVQPVDSIIPKGPVPIFTKGLQNEKVKMGGRLTLECKVNVPPWPKSITWFNNGGAVESGGRYHIMEDGVGSYTINVDPVEAVDEGEWKCVAVSNNGVNGISKCQVTVSYPKNYKKPKFLESLKAILTEEGLVSFECKVVGYPTPQLRWFKDGHELKPGDVYQLTGTNSLGSYCCIAKNCMGETSSTAELTVEDIQSQLNDEERLQLFSINQPPSFVQGLKSLEAKIADPLRLTVQVSVSPRPTVDWYRDDEQIEDSDKYKKEQETKGACHLIIKSLELIDQAEWKCVATNDYGQSVTSCFLKLVVPSHYKKPRFLENLQAVLSNEGAVNLECKVIGVPQPTLKWYKDGRELKPGDIHRIISGQDGTCCLGTYTCEASNCMGTVSSSASLLGFEDHAQLKLVEPSRSIPPAASLVRQSSLSTIQEERTSQLHDIVTVDDRPEVSFSFDGREVSVSLYETPDLTEEEALQVIEMYAEELSEHISGLQEVQSLEHNVVELPPMRFVKETSTSGHILMEAVVIDVSPEYYASAEDRTDADFDELSITEDNGFMSPMVTTPDEMPFDKFTAEILEQSKRVGQQTVPAKPPRKRVDGNGSLNKSYKEDKLSPEEESSENFIDALTSQNETISKENIEFLSTSDKQIVTLPSDAGLIETEAKTTSQRHRSGSIKHSKTSRSRSKSTEKQSIEKATGDVVSNKSNQETNKLKGPMNKNKEGDSDKDDDSLREFEKQKQLRTQKDEKFSLNKEEGGSITAQQRIVINKGKSTESEKEDDSLQEFEKRKSLYGIDKCTISNNRRIHDDTNKITTSDSSGREDDSLIEYERRKILADKTSDENGMRSDRNKARLIKSTSTESSEKDEAFSIKNKISENAGTRKKRKKSVKNSDSSVKKEYPVSESGGEIIKFSDPKGLGKGKVSASTSDLDRMKSTSDLESIGDKSRVNEDDEHSADFDTAEDSAYDKSEISVLESLHHSIKEMKMEIAVIEEKIISESSEEVHSAKSSLSIIGSLVKPINEIQQELELVQVEHLAKDNNTIQYSPCFLLESIKGPLQELGRNLELVKEDTIIKSNTAGSLNNNSLSLLEAVTQPLQDLQKELTFIQQQAVIETGDETYSEMLKSFIPSLLVVQGGVEQSESEFTSNIDELVDNVNIPQCLYAQAIEQEQTSLSQMGNEQVSEVDSFVPLTVQEVENSLVVSTPELPLFMEYDLSLELNKLAISLETCKSTLHNRAQNTKDDEIKDLLVSVASLIHPIKQLTVIINKCIKLLNKSDLNQPSNLILKSMLESNICAIRKCGQIFDTVSLSKSNRDIRGLAIKTCYKLHIPIEELKTTMKLVENLSGPTAIELLVVPVEALIMAISVINLETAHNGFAENIPQVGLATANELDESIKNLCNSLYLITKPEIIPINDVKVCSSLDNPLLDLQRSLNLIENLMQMEDNSVAISNVDLRINVENICKSLQELRAVITYIQQEIELDQCTELFIKNEPQQSKMSDFELNPIYHSLDQLNKSVITSSEFLTSKLSNQTLHIRYLIFSLNELIIPLNQLRTAIMESANISQGKLFKLPEPSVAMQELRLAISDVVKVLPFTGKKLKESPNKVENNLVDIISYMAEPLQQFERELNEIITQMQIKDQSIITKSVIITLNDSLKKFQTSLLNISKALDTDVVLQDTFFELKKPIQDIQRNILIIQDHASFEYSNEPVTIEGNLMTLQSLSQQFKMLKGLFIDVNSTVQDYNKSIMNSQENKCLHSIIKANHDLQLKLSSLMVQENYVNKHSLDSSEIFPIFHNLFGVLREFENSLQLIDLIFKYDKDSALVIHERLSEAVNAFIHNINEYQNKIILESNKAIKDPNNTIHFMNKITKMLIKSLSSHLKSPNSESDNKLSIIIICNKVSESLMNFSKCLSQIDSWTGEEIVSTHDTDIDLVGSSHVLTNDTIQDVSKIIDEISQSRISLQEMNVATDNELLVSCLNEIKIFCDALKNIEEVLIKNVSMKACSSGFSEDKNRDTLKKEFNSLCVQLDKIDTFIKNKYEHLSSISEVRRSLDITQEHLYYAGKLSEIYIVQNIMGPLNLFQDQIISLQFKTNLLIDHSISSYLDLFEKSASDLELGLMKLEHALLNSTGDFSSFKNIDIDVIAQPIKELVNYIELIERKQTQLVLIEKAADQSVLSMLRTLALPIQEIQTGIQAMQEQITLDTGDKSRSGRSCSSILYDIAKPIRELRSGVALIQEQVVTMEECDEQLVEDSKITPLRKLAEPIEELKKLLSIIDEKQICGVKADLGPTFGNISVLQEIATPLKKLQSKLASVDVNNKFEERAENFSTKDKLLALARPVHELKQKYAFVESQLTFEYITDDSESKETLTLLKRIAKPLMEIAEGIAVLKEQHSMEKLSHEDNTVMSDLSTLASITDVTLQSNILNIEEVIPIEQGVSIKADVAKKPTETKADSDIAIQKATEKQLTSTLPESATQTTDQTQQSSEIAGLSSLKTLVPPIKELKEVIACINEQHALVLEPDLESISGNISVLQTVATPLKELQNKLASIDINQIFEGDVGEFSNKDKLLELAQPVYELQKNYALVENQLIFEGIADDSPNKENLTLLKKIAKPLVEIAKGIAVIVEQQAMENVFHEDDTVMSDLSTLASTTDVTLQSNILNIEEVIPIEQGVSIKADFTKKPAETKADSNIAIGKTAEKQKKAAEKQLTSTLPDSATQTTDHTQQSSEIAGLSSLKTLAAPIKELKEVIACINKQHALVLEPDLESISGNISVLQTMATPLKELQNTLASIDINQIFEGNVGEFSNKDKLLELAQPVYELQKNYALVDNQLIFEGIADDSPNKENLTLLKKIAKPLVEIAKGIAVIVKQQAMENVFHEDDTVMSDLSTLASTTDVTLQSNILNIEEVIPIEQGVSIKPDVAKKPAETKADSDITYIGKTAEKQIKAAEKQLTSTLPDSATQTTDHTQQSSEIAGLSSLKTLAAPIKELKEVIACINKQHVLVLEPDLESISGNISVLQTMATPLKELQNKLASIDINQIFEGNVGEFSNKDKLLELAQPVYELQKNYALVENQLIFEGITDDSPNKENLTLLKKIAKPLVEIAKGIAVIVEQQAMENVFHEDDTVMSDLSTLASTKDVTLQSNILNIEEVIPIEQGVSIKADVAKKPTETKADSDIAIQKATEKQLTSTLPDSAIQTTVQTQQPSEIAGFSSLKTLVPPIKELKEVIACINEQHALVLEPDLESISGNISVLQTMATPLKELQNKLASIDINQIFEGNVGEFSNKDKLLELAQPVYELQKNYALVENQLIFEGIADDSPNKENLTLLKKIAKPLVEIAKGIAVIVQQQAMENVFHEDDTVMSDLSTLASTTDVTLQSNILNIEEVIPIEQGVSIKPDVAKKPAETKADSDITYIGKTAEKQIKAAEKQLTSTLPDSAIQITDQTQQSSEIAGLSSLKTLAAPIKELKEVIACINEQHALVFEPDLESISGNISVLQTMATPLKELQHKLALIDINQIFEGNVEEFSCKDKLLELAQPVYELQKNYALVENQLIFEGIADDSPNKENLTLLKKIAKPLVEIAKGIAVIVEQQAMENVFHEDDTVMSDLSTLASTTDVTLQSNILNIEEVIPIEQGVSIKPDVVKKPAETKADSDITYIGKTAEKQIKAAEKQLTSTLPDSATQTTDQTQQSSEIAGLSSLKTLAAPIKELKEVIACINEQHALVFEPDLESISGNISVLQTMATPLKELQHKLALIDINQIFEGNVEEFSCKDKLLELAQPVYELQKNYALVENQFIFEGIADDSPNKENLTLLKKIDKPLVEIAKGIAVIVEQQTMENLIHEDDTVMSDLSTLASTTDVTLRSNILNIDEVIPIEQGESIKEDVAKKPAETKADSDIAIGKTAEKQIKAAEKQLTSTLPDSATQTTDQTQQSSEIAGLSSLKTLSAPIKELKEIIACINEQHALVIEPDLESISENISVLQTRATPLKELQNKLASIDINQIFEGNVEEFSSKDKLLELAQHVYELQKNYALVENQLIFEGIGDDSPNKENLTLLKKIAKPLVEIAKGIAVILEQQALENLFHEDDTVMSDLSTLASTTDVTLQSNILNIEDEGIPTEQGVSIKTDFAKKPAETKTDSDIAIGKAAEKQLTSTLPDSLTQTTDHTQLSSKIAGLSSVKTLAAPIKELKEVIASINEQHALVFEPDLESISGNISVLQTMATPLKELQNKLASIDINQIFEGNVEEFSCKDKLLELAQPVYELQHNYALVENQLIFEDIANASPNKENLTLLTKIAKPLVEITKGIAVIVEHTMDNGVIHEDGTVISDVSTLASITDVTLQKSSVLNIEEVIPIDKVVTLKAEEAKKHLETKADSDSAIGKAAEKQMKVAENKIKVGEKQMMVTEKQMESTLPELATQATEKSQKSFESGLSSLKRTSLNSDASKKSEEVKADLDTSTGKSSQRKKVSTSPESDQLMFDNLNPDDGKVISETSTAMNSKDCSITSDNTIKNVVSVDLCIINKIDDSDNHTDEIRVTVEKIEKNKPLESTPIDFNLTLPIEKVTKLNEEIKVPQSIEYGGNSVLSKGKLEPSVNDCKREIGILSKTDDSIKTDSEVHTETEIINKEICNELQKQNTTTQDKKSNFQDLQSTQHTNLSCENKTSIATSAGLDESNKTALENTSTVMVKSSIHSVDAEKVEYKTLNQDITGKSRKSESFIDNENKNLSQISPIIDQSKLLATKQKEDNSDSQGNADIILGDADTKNKAVKKRNIIKPIEGNASSYGENGIKKVKENENVNKEQQVVLQDPSNNNDDKINETKNTSDNEAINNKRERSVGLDKNKSLKKKSLLTEKENTFVKSGKELTSELHITSEIDRSSKNDTVIQKSNENHKENSELHESICVTTLPNIDDNENSYNIKEQKTNKHDYLSDHNKKLRYSDSKDSDSSKEIEGNGKEGSFDIINTSVNSKGSAFQSKDNSETKEKDLSNKMPTENLLEDQNKTSDSTDVTKGSQPIVDEPKLSIKSVKDKKSKVNKKSTTNIQSICSQDEANSQSKPLNTAPNVLTKNERPKDNKDCGSDERCSSSNDMHEKFKEKYVPNTLATEIQPTLKDNKTYREESSTSDYSTESCSESFKITKSQSCATRQWICDPTKKSDQPQVLEINSCRPTINGNQETVHQSLPHGKLSYKRHQTSNKPIFCGKLVDRTASQGSRLKVTCSLVGNPDPTVRWYKNGQIISLPDHDRVHTALSNGLASLEITNATLGDSGKYTCVASNCHGETSTTSDIKIYSYLETAPEAPTFTKSVKDQYKSTSDQLIIECRVKGHPQPSITWFKDNQPLKVLYRYQQSVLTDGTCRLVIHGPEPSDSGLYKCEAKNAVWSEQTSAFVLFEGREKYLAESRKLTDIKLPRFTNVMLDHVVREGGTIALQVAVKGTPRADITWYRGSQPLPKKSSRYRYLEDSGSGVYSLVLPEASKREAGTYTCRASNVHGSRDTSVNVEIVGTSLGGATARGKPAMFLSRPDTSMSIAVGEDITVSFRVSGDPKPRVTWMKGMRDITYDMRNLKETVNDYMRLSLKHATIMDSGTYFITAKNIYGADHAFVTVKVRQRARSLTPTRNLWSAPDVSTVLRDIHESTKALIKDVPGPISGEAKVSDSGKNWVSLTWDKPEHRGAAPVLAYRVEAWLLGSETSARWTELGVTPINSFDAFFLKPGADYKFRITARNRYGWGESVTSTDSIRIGSVSNSPPEIIHDLLGPLKVLQNDSVTLECEICGDPQPNIQWLKDGHDVITLGELEGRVFVSDSQQIHKLIIKKLIEDDSGRYVCEATNKLGRASTYARLFVVSDPRLLEADSKLKENIAENQELAPQITMRLRDRRVQASYPVRLTCQVVGNPTPIISWAHNGQPITTDDRYQIIEEADHFYTLEINRTLVEESGQYTVNAKNCLGAISCHCQLTVDKGIRAYIAPDFISELSPTVSLVEGSELRIFAQVEAYPTVGITWQRDGVRLRPSRRLVTTVDPEGRVELALANVTDRDAGLYCCVATNIVGRAETSCQVVITKRASPPKATIPSTIISSDILYSKEPRFITKPLSSDAVEGDTVVITCEVTGDPQPEVMWLRDWLKVN